MAAPSLKGGGLRRTALGDERVDVLSIKDSLVDALAENGPRYWDALRKFVTGKLSRQEFDGCTGRLLNKETAALHNALVVATIRNALGTKPPSPSEATTGWGHSRKREGNAEQPVMRATKKRRKVQLAKIAAGIGKADRERLKGILAKQRDSAVTAFQPRRAISLPAAPSTPVPSTYAKDYAIGLHTSLCTESRHLPDLRTMRQRMHQIALHEGLVGGISEQAAELMTYALEAHLKNVITACVDKVRARALCGTEEVEQPALPDPFCAEGPVATNPPPPPLSSATAGREPKAAPTKPAKALLLKGDLEFAFALTPNILVEMPLGRERWFLSEGDGEEDEEQGL